MSTYRLEWLNHHLELGRRTAIMAILNVTPDSFSDGGKFFKMDAALAQAEQMVAEGADILDIGGESSRPFSDPVTVEEESRRVLPIVEHLAPRIPVPISVDTTKAEVARRAIDAGASIINDISALRSDPKMGELTARTGALLVMMHMKGSPKTMQANPTYTDLIEEICGFLQQAIDRACIAGVNKSHIIVDPGIGFGKTVSHNLQIVNRLNRFAELGVPVLLGHSRKAFIRKILSQHQSGELPPDHPDVESGTQAIVAAAVIKGAHIVRVHNVANTRRTLQLMDAIRNNGHFWA